MFSICGCLGSQLSSLIQSSLVPNDTASSFQLATNTSAEDIFKNFISEGAMKPKDVDNIIIKLKDLIEEQDGYVRDLDAKIKGALDNWNKVKNVAAKAIALSEGELDDQKKATNKVKQDEGNKVSSAKQAHDDAKLNKINSMANINHQKLVLNQVIDLLRPLSTQTLIKYDNEWDNCYNKKNYPCSSFKEVDSVCVGGYQHQPSTKTLKNLFPSNNYTVTLDFFAMYSWDNEYAEVKVNGARCWYGNIRAVNTGKDCGPWDRDHAQHFAVSCDTVSDKTGEIKLYVNTGLNQVISDEYYAVGNVQVKKR